MDSIILDHLIKESLIADAQEFLASSSWYASRGIPYRRGYLLHGAPGNGKTSLVHALAGELKLDIFIISLSKPGMNDATLNNLICDLPSHALLLIEDIDVAFSRPTLDKKGFGSSLGQEPWEAVDPSRGFGAGPMITGVTLSGLLNAIDGIYAQEGTSEFYD